MAWPALIVWLLLENEKELDILFLAPLNVREISKHREGGPNMRGYENFSIYYWMNIFIKVRKQTKFYLK